MKIWIDFINSPQVCFFDPLVDELTNKGHEFIFTCRDSSNTVQLVRQRNWDHAVIGNSARKSLLGKLFAFPSRVNALYHHLRKRNADVSICQSSFYVPVTAKLLGIPSIYTNDNEHALGNIPSFLFATRIFIPENTEIKKMIRQGAMKQKIVQYPGIKEGIYLWVKGREIQTFRKINNNSHRIIYIRPEPLNAEYYSGKVNFLDSVVIELLERYQVSVLVRDISQYKHYTQEKFRGVEVPENPLSFEIVAKNCLLFIGAGGTMTREMAMLGIPTISVYDGELLGVDRYLISEKLLIHQPTISTNNVESILKDKIGHEERSKLMDKGKEAYNLIVNDLLSFQNDKSRINRTW